MSFAGRSLLDKRGGGAERMQRRAVSSKNPNTNRCDLV